MKQRNPLFNIFYGFFLIFLSLSLDSIIMGGMGLFSIIFGIFESKKYNNPKLLIAISTLILAISLVLTYFQQSSFSDNIINYILAIFFLLIIIIMSYDYSHDDKASKILQMNNLSQSNKDIIAVGLVIVGVIVGLCMGFYF